MSKGDWINLGVLVITGLSTLAALTYFTFRWVKSRFFSPRLILNSAHLDRIYISKVIVRRDDPPVVSQLAAWFELHIYNTGANPKLITRITTRQGKLAVQDIIGPPIRELILDFENETPSGPIPLPITLEPGQGLHFWILGQFFVPEKLGEILFELYGGDVRQIPTFKRWNSRFAEIENYITQGVLELELPIKEVSYHLGNIELAYPILENRIDKLVLLPKFGIIKTAVRHHVFGSAKRRGWNLTEITAVEGNLDINVACADGRTLTQRIELEGDALWWSSTKISKKLRRKA